MSKNKRHTKRGMPPIVKKIVKKLKKRKIRNTPIDEGINVTKHNNGARHYW